MIDNTNIKAVYPYKLGLALAGGGARGFAHLGALKALEERNIRPDVISGTSAGALAAVLYADGHSPKKILSLFSSMKFSRFTETALPKEGFLKITGLQKFLKQHLQAKYFEDLKIPVRVVATDLEEGKSRIFSQGEIIPAVLASCSVPVVFVPVCIDGHYYVDGGVLRNFPVSTIRKDCARIIGVNVSPLTPVKYVKSLRHIAETSFHYMQVSNSLPDCDLCDYLIESTDLSRFSMFDLSRMDEIYQVGYKVSSECLEENKVKLREDFAPEVSKTTVERFQRFFKSLYPFN